MVARFKRLKWAAAQHRPTWVLTLALLLGACPIFGAHVYVDTPDFQGSVLTNAEVRLTPTGPVRVSGGKPIRQDWRTSITDAAGRAWFSNTVEGTYKLELEGPVTKTTFKLSVPSTNGVISAADCSDAATNTVTSVVGWADGRYERTSSKAQPNGYAPLDEDGLVPAEHLPPASGGSLPTNLATTNDVAEAVAPLADTNRVVQATGISVKWAEYGAKGDGSDATLAFKKAVATAYTNNILDGLSGKTIVIPEGSYFISETIYLPADIQLRFENLATTRIFSSVSNAPTLWHESDQFYRAPTNIFYTGGIEIENVSVFYAGAVPTTPDCVAVRIVGLTNATHIKLRNIFIDRDDSVTNGFFGGFEIQNCIIAELDNLKVSRTRGDGSFGFKFNQNQSGHFNNNPVGKGLYGIDCGSYGAVFRNMVKPVILASSFERCGVGAIFDGVSEGLIHARFEFNDTVQAIVTNSFHSRFFLSASSDSNTVDGFWLGNSGNCFFDLVAPVGSAGTPSGYTVRLFGSVNGTMEYATNFLQPFGSGFITGESGNLRKVTPGETIYGYHVVHFTNSSGQVWMDYTASTPSIAVGTSPTNGLGHDGTGVFLKAGNNKLTVDGNRTKTLGLGRDMFLGNDLATNILSVTRAIDGDLDVRLYSYRPGGNTQWGSLYSPTNGNFTIRTGRIGTNTMQGVDIAPGSIVAARANIDGNFEIPQSLYAKYLYASNQAVFNDIISFEKFSSTPSLTWKGDTNAGVGFDGIWLYLRNYDNSISIRSNRLGLTLQDRVNLNTVELGWLIVEPETRGGAFGLGLRPDKLDGNDQQFDFIAGTNGWPNIIRSGAIGTNQQPGFKVVVNSQTALLVDTNAQVGFGTEQPTNKVHIVGDLTVTGHINSSNVQARLDAVAAAARVELGETNGILLADIRTRQGGGSVLTNLSAGVSTTNHVAFGASIDLPFRTNGFGKVFIADTTVTLNTGTWPTANGAQAITYFLVGTNAACTVTLNSNWKVFGTNSVFNLPANKVVAVQLYKDGSAETDVYASYCHQY